MSKPKNMTPEQDAAYKARNRIYARKWREANPEKCRVNKMKSRHKNPELYNNYSSKQKKKHPEKTRIRNRRRHQELRDGYIVRLLIQGTDLTKEDIPQNFISLKREHLKLKRKLKTNDQ